MSKTLILTEDAQQDLNSAYQWYKKQNQGLGQEFIRCVDAKLSEISRNLFITRSFLTAVFIEP